MALPSTVFKVELHVSDMDRHYYQTHNLTLARHPSETDERLMMRVLAFARHASDSLAFGLGLSSQDEPDLWDKDLQGAIKLWIMVGLPDEKQFKKACRRSEKVVIYAYGGLAADTWWKKQNLLKLNNLVVVNVPVLVSHVLEQGVERSMKIQCSIQDGLMWWTDKDGTSEFEFAVLKGVNR